MSKDIRKMIDKVKNFKEFVNENIDNSITNHINQLKKEYLDKYGIDACDINKSECHNFAEALENILTKNGYKNIEILTTDLFIDTATEFSKDDEDEIFYNPLDYGSVKPNNFKWLKNGYHAWVYVNNKHYDSDAPDGVSNFYDLPIFVNERG